MKWIRLTSVNGDTLLINFEHARTIARTRDGGTQITMGGGDYVTVKEAPEEVESIIRVGGDAAVSTSVAEAISAAVKDIADTVLAGDRSRAPVASTKEQSRGGKQNR